MIFRYRRLAFHFETASASLSTAVGKPEKQLRKFDICVIPATFQRACFAPGEEIVPSKELVVERFVKSTKLSNLKLPVAPANRPVPPEMNAVSTIEKTPGVGVWLDAPVKSAVSVSPLAAVNAMEPIAVPVVEFTMCGMTSVNWPSWLPLPVAFTNTPK